MRRFVLGSCSCNVKHELSVLAKGLKKKKKLSGRVKTKKHTYDDTAWL